MKQFCFFFVLVLVISCSHDRKKEFYESGQVKEVVNLKNNLPDGEYRSYFENGYQQAQGTYSNGVMTNDWSYWSDNGKLLSIATYNDEGNLVNLQAWDSTGNQTIVNCTGVAIVNYPNGQPMSQVSYRACKMNGQWITWFENGQIESEIYYEEGVPVGIWKYWNPDGTISKVERQGGGIFQ